MARSRWGRGIKARYCPLRSSAPSWSFRTIRPVPWVRFLVDACCVGAVRLRLQRWRPITLPRLAQQRLCTHHPTGLLHISELEHGRTQKVEDVVSVAERLEVMVVGKDQRGNIKLSLKALLPTPRPPSNAPRS